MLRGRDPVSNNLLELRSCHAGVRGHDNLQEGMFAACERAFHVTFKQRRKGFLCFPFRMLRRKRLHALKREEELEIQRLLTPERPVVIESGNAFLRRDKVL